MTKINCASIGCGWNTDGVCTKNEIELDFTFRGEQPQCTDRNGRRNPDENRPTF